MPEEFTGPSTPTREKLQAVIDLANRVFRTKRPGDMGAEFPLLFGPDRLQCLRVFEKDGRPVSLVATVINDTVLLGCSVRVACIGSVCTDPDCRGRGLAGRLMDDAVERARAAGAALMLISGRRTLYTRRGSHGEGRFDRYELVPEQLPETTELTVTELPPQACRGALRMHEAEPIRFRRTEAQYAAQIACGFVQDAPGKTYAVRRGDRLVAVFSVRRLGPPTDDASESGVLVAEKAGSRTAVLEALRPIAEQWGAERIKIDAYPTDAVLREACGRIGASAETASFYGTFKLLDAARAWRDYGPLLAERLGPELYGQISIEAESDPLKIHTVTFQRGAQLVELRGAREILAALFGSKEIDPLAEAEGELADALRQALPLPVPMYGLNYV